MVLLMCRSGFRLLRHPGGMLSHLPRHRGGLWAVLSDLADGEGAAELPRWVGRLAGLLAALIRLPLAGLVRSLPALMCMVKLDGL